MAIIKNKNNYKTFTFISRNVIINTSKGLIRWLRKKRKKMMKRRNLNRVMK